ncbi:hypothetical protein B0A64_09935 [Flavobacterium araucananum]|uniref:Uncharacterized protein n=1 Tax=Flavobacterium araucananum TaxID=946678 RepID=A0A227PBH5_9FLAO|nr:hypothetical protein B0A64_09935 [Flavobacterium araucananum]
MFFFILFCFIFLIFQAKLDKDPARIFEKLTELTKIETEILVKGTELKKGIQALKIAVGAGI